MNDATLLSGRRLSLSYGALAALVDVDVDLWPGEMLAVVGESGSGKTTLLTVLSGRLSPDAGAVWYRDPAGRLHDVHAMPAPALRAASAESRSKTSASLSPSGSASGRPSRSGSGICSKRSATESTPIAASICARSRSRIARCASSPSKMTPNSSTFCSPIPS